MYVRPSVCVSVRDLQIEPFDLRGSALLSAVKSNKSHYQSEMFVCVSVTSGHMQIIARMQSSGF